MTSFSSGMMSIVFRRFARTKPSKSYLRSRCGRNVVDAVQLRAREHVIAYDSRKFDGGQARKDGALVPLNSTSLRQEPGN